MRPLHKTWLCAALQQKLQWTRAALALNVSVLWLDIDILVLQPLLPHLLAGRLADADMVVQMESCK